MSESYTQDARQVVLNDTYTFSPTLLNQATFSFLTSMSNQVQDRTVAPSEYGINLPQYTPTGHPP